MRLIVPIIKLKTEQCKSELRNKPFQSNINRLSKIYEVLTNRIEAYADEKKIKGLGPKDDGAPSHHLNDSMSAFERL